MASERVQRFLDALRQVEEAGDLGPMTSLFTSDCDVGNVVAPHAFQGVEGARRFWEEYQANFDEVRSRFESILELDDKAVLEWTSRGELLGGHPVEYEGVTVLEFQGDQIRAFRAYFDSAKLTQQLLARGPGRSVTAEPATPAIQ